MDIPPDMAALQMQPDAKDENEETRDQFLRPFAIQELSVHLPYPITDPYLFWQRYDVSVTALRGIPSPLWWPFRRSRDPYKLP
jgi:hypothetical protein